MAIWREDLNAASAAAHAGLTPPISGRDAPASSGYPASAGGGGGGHGGIHRRPRPPTSSPGLRTKRAGRATSVLAAVALTAAAVAISPAWPEQHPVAPRPATVTLLGSGFGHGVGMSQYGALGQAQAGRSADQILTYYYSGTKVAPVADSILLKVNLVHQASSVRFHTVALGAGGGGLRVTIGGVGQFVSSPSDVWSATSSAAGLVLKRTTGRSVTTFRPTTAVTIRWAGTRYLAGPPTLIDVAGPGHALTDSNDLYRSGVLEMRQVGGALEVSDVLRLHDEYLDGIAEMPSSWPLQALRAQVIAARTFALHAYGNGAVRASCDCHLYDSTVSQVYSGWAKQSEPGWGAAWVAAVASTSASPTTGLAILSAGKPIQAFFTSSTGGATRSSQSVWGGSLPYAVGVSDAWSLDPRVNPEAAWRMTVTAAQLRNAAFPSLRDIARFRLTEFNRDGTLAIATAWSSSGATASVSGAALASGLGLPSQWVSSFLTTLANSQPPSVDVRAVPGYRAAGGREWLTWCLPVGPDTRCTVWIKATTVVGSASGYSVRYGWTPDGITYLARLTAAWNLNPLAVPGTHRVGGRVWQVTCSSPTGPRRCVDQLWTTVVSAKSRPGGGFSYSRYATWAFASEVRLTR
jgi:SpoIID/LytB domain protein